MSAYIPSKPCISRASVRSNRQQIPEDSTVYIHTYTHTYIDIYIHVHNIPVLQELRHGQRDNELRRTFGMDEQKP
jgi:hypothetical protein